MSAPRQNGTRKGSMMTGRLVRARQVLHRPLVIFSVIGPSFAIWSGCPGGSQDFSQFLSFCEPLLGYSLIIGINVFSHERILRTVVV